MSTIYTELLDHLHRHIEGTGEEARVALEEGSPKSYFQELLKESLSPTSADEEIPLSEIIDSYQHLFEANRPIHLERKLLEAFSKKEFSELGMERDFPHIYRGLPRLYLHSHPVENHIKKNFTHLPTILRSAAERALFRLYEKIELPAGVKVILFTWVLSSRYSDVHLGTELSEALQARFPHLEVRRLLLAPKGLTIEESIDYLVPYEGQCPPLSQIPATSLRALQTADLVLQLPTYYPYTSEIKQEKNAFYSFGDYGFLESSWFHPRTGRRAMGLHFLERGIVIREAQRAGLSSLQSPLLQTWLFSSTDPTPSQVERYLETHQLFLADLETPVGGAVYLHALLKAFEKEKRGIDLLSSNLSWFVRYLEQRKRENAPLLEGNWNIRSIEIHLTPEEVHSLKLKKRGKVLRLFSFGAVSRSDFRALLQMSEEFIAVRDSYGFSEAVSTQKPFFYDGREENRYFMKDLLALAANRLTTYPKALHCIRGMGKTFLHNLAPQEEKWVDETHFQEKEPWPRIASEMSALLCDPMVAIGYRKLSEILREEHSFSDFLFHFLQREFCHRTNPEIAHLEQEQLSLFAAGSCSFSSVVASLKDAVRGA